MAAAAAFAVVRGLELLREARSTSRALGPAVDHVAVAAERASRKADELGSGSERLGRSLARLETSRARLQILLRAYEEARSTLTGFVFIPRK